MLLKPKIPGTVIRFRGETVPRINPSFADTVAIPLVHDWGPMGSEDAIEVLANFAEWAAKYGDSDTPGRTAVAGAFAGQSLQGAGGAGGVLPYRMGTAAAARATHAFNNTTPAAALTINAKWKGTRGNRIDIVIDDDPNDAANKDRLRVRLDGVVQETYSYANTDINALAAVVNARSNLITAVATISGVALAATAGTALAGGNDGDVLTATEWLDALDGLEFGQFSILAPFDLTDSGIQASLLSWLQSQNDADRPVMAVIGGAAGEDIDDAITRSAALDDEHIVNFGVGTWHDDLLDKDLSTAQLAPRVAGILAARGDERSLTYAKLGGIHMVGSTGAPIDAVERAVENGVTVLMRATAPDAEVRIAMGVTTFTDDNDVSRPLDVFSDPRLVRIMDTYKRNMKAWGDDTIIGNVPVGPDARRAVAGQGRLLQEDLLRRGLILTKAQGASEDPFVTAEDPGDPGLLDAIPYQFGWQFARTANFVLGEGTVR